MFHWINNVVRTYCGCLFSKPLAATLTHRRLRFELCEDRRMLTTMADIVFLVDERISPNSEVQSWLGHYDGIANVFNGIATELDTQLTTAGIDARYGLVGFGDNDNFGLAHTHSLSDSEVALFGNANELEAAALLGTTPDSDLYGDGWDAIEHAIGEYEFRDRASVILILIQDDVGRDELVENGEELTNPALTREGLLAAMASKNIRLNSIVEADFDQIDPADDLFLPGGVVYGVEADEIGNGLQKAHVENPQPNNGLSTNVFQDIANGGPHRINGAPGPGTANPGDTDNDYVRLAWDTGGAAWNVSVINDNFNSNINPQTDPEMLEFNATFIDSIMDQIGDLQSAGEVAFADDPLLEINFGSNSQGSYNQHTTVSGLSISSGDIIEKEDTEKPFLGLQLNHTNTIPDNADEPGVNGDGGDLFLEGYQSNANNLNISLDQAAVPNGSYVVELFFAELGGTEMNPVPEQRVFDVVLEDVTVLEDYEIFDDHSDNGFDEPVTNFGDVVSIGHLGAATREAGNNDDSYHGLHGVVKRFRVDVTDDDGLKIELKRNPAIGVRDPLINGLRILTIDEVGPRVENVIISNSVSVPDDFNPAYDFDAARYDNPTTTINENEAVIGSGNQLRTVPVAGADTIEIVFDEAVVVSAGDLSLIGLTTIDPVNNGLTMPSLAANGFSYDSASFTAKWTFADWNTPDFYRILLSDSVTDLAGIPLDGEWTNPGNISTVNESVSEFPSGDGTAGGSFSFLVTILPGDATQDGIVDGLDGGILSAYWGMIDTTFQNGDFNGDGVVNEDDIEILMANTSSTFYIDVWIMADLNGDLIVDGLDAGILINNYGKENPTFEEGDLNSDGFIDGIDVAILTARFGLSSTNVVF